MLAHILGAAAALLHVNLVNLVLDIMAMNTLPLRSCSGFYWLSRRSHYRVGCECAGPSAEWHRPSVCW